MKVQGHIPPSAPLGAREVADLDVPLITRIGLILGGILVLLVLATAVIFYLYEKQYPHRTSEAAPIVTVAELPPAPRLQATPRADFQQVHAQEDAHLQGYAWVDHTKGIARIPIEQAMTRWVELQNAGAATNGGGPETNAPPLNPFPITAAGGSTTAAPPANTGAASTTSSPANTTELQMRQDKAKEATHAH